MDNTEYTIKKDEIRSLIAQKEYAQAVEIADTVDWRRVRSVMMLCTISDLYKINRRYEDAKNMLLLAYEYRPGGRSICYSLCELCIKMEEFVEAVGYYKEFVQAAPKDPDRYVLQYKLYEAQDVSLEERIDVLKELKQKEYREKWAYELAYLYHRIGQATLCVEECDELILWFGDGKYVYKAMELKMLHEPLSPSQQEKYDHRLDGIRMQENVPKASQAAAYPQSQEQNRGYEQSQGYVQSQDYEQSQGYVQSQDYEQSQGYVQSQDYEQSQGYVQSQDYEQSQGYEQSQLHGQSQGYMQGQGYANLQEYEQPQALSQTYENSQNFDQHHEGILRQGSPEPEAAERFARMQPSYGEQDFEDKQNIISAEAEQGNGDKAAESDIQVPIVDIGQYNTINLQAEIAAGLQEVLEKEGRAQADKITRSIIAPMLESDTGRMDVLDVEQLDEDEPDIDTGEVEETEVFFGETGEINSVRLQGVKEIVPEINNGRASETVPEMTPETVPEMEAAVRLSDVGGDTKVFEIVHSRNDAKRQENTGIKTDAGSSAGNGTAASGRNEAGSKIEASGSAAASVDAQAGALPAVNQAADETAELVMNQMRMENKAEAQVMIAQPPRELANVLSQESDGQISLVMPERESVEKQITGQMSIEDILAEWERIKQESVERRKAELQQRVLQQTGNMFTEFEAAVRDGLLEKLESEIDQELKKSSEKGEPEELEIIQESKELEPIQEPEYEAEPAPAYEAEPEFEPEPAPAYEAEPEFVPEPKPAPAVMYEPADEEPVIEEPAPEAQPEYEAEPEPAYVPEYEAEPAPAYVPEYEAKPAPAYEAEPEFVPEPKPAPAAMYEPADEEPVIEEPAAEAQPEYEPEPEPAYVPEAEYEAKPAPAYEAEPEFKPEPAPAVMYEPADEEPVIEEPAPEAQPEYEPEPEPAYVPEAEYNYYESQEAGGPAAAENAEAKEPEGSYQPEEPERPPVRKLTREERELYAPYIQSRSAREQLVKAIDNISMAAYTGNIVIMGEEGMNTITLAKNMIREVQMMDRNFSGKVAKISGQGFNQRNVKETLEQLKNGALIIEKASGMDIRTASELARFLRQDNVGIIIVLEDTRKGIARLFAENPRLRTSFTARMNVEALSNDTLASFGMKYARQMEFSIDDLGMLALHKRIEELQTIDHVVTVVEVKNIVDNAIRHASKKTLGHFMDILFAKRYDEEDMIILTEKDFV